MSATTTALLEREEELATIEQALDAAAGGGGGLLMIEGEAGAGKTALLEAAARLGEERKMRVLHARGGEYERDFPYGVVRQLFESLLADGARREELLSGNAAPAAPIFEPGAAPAAGADPFSVQHGLHWLIAALAGTSPLVLLADDAQWADLASLRALTYIARRLDALPAVLALTVRTGEPGEHDRLLAELRREPNGRLIAPPPLSVGAAAALVAGEVGRQPSDCFAEACCSATAGNPFLLVQLLRALDSEGTEPTDENAERLAEVAAAGVSRSILARLARLGEHSSEVARAVAVLEPNAEARLIAALSGLPPKAVADASERLVVAGLLSDSRPLTFVHPLVRAAVLSDVPAPRRAADHARVARLLSEDGAASDAVASHLLLAEPSADVWAAAELRSAAAAALSRGAPDAAVSYLRRALREPPAKDDRIAVSRELGMALLRADNPEGIDVLRAVRSALEDSRERAEIAAVLSQSLGLRSHNDEAFALLEESLAETSDWREDFGLFLRGHMLLLVLLGLERVPEGMLPDPAEGLDGSSFERRRLLGLAAYLQAIGLGTMADARELAERAISDPATREVDALAGMPGHLIFFVLTLADRGEPVDPYEGGIDASRRRGSLPAVASGHGVRSWDHLATGELREAQADAEVAVRLTHRLGFSTQSAIWVTAAVKALVERGDFTAAEQLLGSKWGEREPGPGLPGSALLCARGELRQATGRHAEARHDFLAAAERVSWLPYPNPELLGWRTGLASCEAALGNREEAHRLAGEATGLAREAGGSRGIGIALRIQGTVTDGAAGIELLREAAEVLAGTRARLQHAHALVDLGAALRRANHRREAREPLREGLDLAHRCGAAPLEERARTELAATGARPRKAVLSGVDSLTPSELRVARMAAEGMTNREIAQSLTVTPKTIETHMRHIFQKLDVDRRTKLAGALAPGPPPN